MKDKNAEQILGSAGLKEKKPDIPLRMLFACVILVMFIFSCMSPMISDDFNYGLSFLDGSRITNPGMIIPSMAAHRVNTNGRIISHTLVQLLVLAPKVVFNALNALNCVGMLYLLLRFVIPDRQTAGGRSAKSLLVMLCAVSMIWYFTPAFGNVFLWMDGACNYTWAVSIMLLFLLPFYMYYMGTDRELSWGGKLGFLVLAFVAGAYNENCAGCAGFVAFCFLTLGSLRRKKLDWFFTAALAMAALGVLLLMTSPAEQSRAGNLSFTLLYFNFLKVVNNYLLQQLGWLFCIYGAMLALAILAGVPRRSILSSLIIVVGGVLSACEYVFAAYIPPRGFCTVTICLVLASLLLFAQLWDRGYKAAGTALTGVLVMLFAFSFVLGALDILLVYRCSLNREAEIAKAHETGVVQAVLSPYQFRTPYTAVSDCTDITEDPEYWTNVSFAKYYGFDSVKLGEGIADSD